MGAVEIRGLWLHEEERGKSLGDLIVLELEREAISRGARSALLDTYSFQARRFYERIGYECFGTFKYPNDVERFYMRKNL